ncbi:hypothetical protein [Terribacillus sp. JSM ZJ617]|uniref:hypothetical protein n=1 Tax=Terribacillus sp. JSM ZJ617 TaxID=3342119 RepID=UPI0035A8F70F
MATVINHLKDVFGKSLSSANMNIKENNDMYENGLYVGRERTIFISEKNVAESAADLGMDKLKYGRFIFLHELGHAIDPELNVIDKQITKNKRLFNIKGYSERYFNEYYTASMKAEKNAWNIAEKYVIDEDKEDFKIVMKTSLELHQESLEEEKELLIIKGSIR